MILSFLDMSTEQACKRSGDSLSCNMWLGSGSLTTCLFINYCAVSPSMDTPGQWTGANGLPYISPGYVTRS